MASAGFPGWNEVRKAALDTEAVLYAVALAAWRGRDSTRMVRLEELAEEPCGRMWTALAMKDFRAFVPPTGVASKSWKTVRVKLRGEAAH
jgi:hypothetical protein